MLAMKKSTKRWQKNHEVRVSAKCQCCGVNTTYFLEMTPEMIDGILKFAIDVAIGTWCSETEIVGNKYLGTYDYEQVSRGGSLLLYDRNEKDIYELNLDKFLYGVKLVFKRCRDFCYEEIREDHTLDYSERIVDYLIQYAVLGYVKYLRAEDCFSDTMYLCEESIVGDDYAH